MENSSFSIKPTGLNVLQGHKVYLERANPGHTRYIHGCYQNHAFMDRYRLAQSRLLSETELRERLVEEQNYLPQQLKRIEWVIIRLSDKEPLGLASLADYQLKHKRAELLLGIVNPEQRTQSVALEVALLVMEFAFNHANLNKLTSFVYGYNESAQKNTLHLGFQQEAILREHIHTRQGFIDLHQNGLLKKDFQKNKKIAKFSNRLLGRDITAPLIPLIKRLEGRLLLQATNAVFGT